MKIIKKFLIVVIILIATVLVIALFVGKEYSVEREVIINKPKKEVFDYVKFLRNQDNYSKWNKMDPDMKKEFKGADATVGCISSWDSKKDDVGKGEQEIIGIVEGKRIDYEIRFKEPIESTCPSYIVTESVSSDKTKVKWGFKGAMPYPFNIMLLFMNMEEMVGGDLEIGLTNLKVIVDKQ